MSQKRQNRYGIAEWFGKDFLSLNPTARRQLAEIALSKNKEDYPGCPFKSMQCNKSGGVCSIQP